MTHYVADDLLKVMPPAVADLANLIRLTILEHTPHCEEATIPAAKAIHYILEGPDYVPGPFLTLAVTSRSITLVFLYGDQVPDPERLLEGYGGRKRELKITNAHEAKNPALKGLIEAARMVRKR